MKKQKQNKYYLEPNVEDLPLLCSYKKDTVTINVREGTKDKKNKFPKTDVLVTLKDLRFGDTKEKKIRHIYWLVDILIKKQHENDLTNEFIAEFISFYDRIPTFDSHSKEDIKKWTKINFSNVNVKKYKKLNEYGFLTVDSLNKILIYLCGNEKSAIKRAFMFKTLLKLIVSDTEDIYDLIAYADNSADRKEHIN